MTKKQQTKVIKWVGLVLAAFFLLVLIVPLITLSATAGASTVKFYDFFVDISVNFKDFWMLYIFVIALILGVIKYSKKK